MKVGKRAVCGECGTAVLCVVPADDAISCCGEPLKEMGMKELPSSD
jgi:hypothetical protein